MTDEQRFIVPDPLLHYEASSFGAALDARVLRILSHEYTKLIEGELLDRVQQDHEHQRRAGLDTTEPETLYMVDTEALTRWYRDCERPERNKYVVGLAAGAALAAGGLATILFDISALPRPEQQIIDGTAAVASGLGGATAWLAARRLTTDGWNKRVRQYQLASFNRSLPDLLVDSQWQERTTWHESAVGTLLGKSALYTEPRGKHEILVENNHHVSYTFDDVLRFSQNGARVGDLAHNMRHLPEHARGTVRYLTELLLTRQAPIYEHEK
jgi:hypothetical protein